MSLAQLVLLAGMPSAEFFAHWSVLLPFENEHVRSDITDFKPAIKSSETSASFIRFIQLLTAHHASRRCRKGAAEILVNYDDLCPSGKCSYEASGGKDTLGNFPICGKDVPRGYYMFCRGSRNDSRGFSCGLWVLFHSLSVRIEDGESQFAFTAICDFVNFFMCDECRLHFIDMCLSLCGILETARDFVLWVWSTHNRVNERLMKDEASLSTGDPLFPKIIWPPRELCPSCYLSSDQESVEWDHDNVYELLKNYYGPQLVSLCKEKSVIGSKEETISATEDLTVATNAVVVPIGAALAIAVASCAFGALACYLRTQQKNRKLRRSWN
ncbi:sulfhydryl oxidase 2 [Brassica napus]|uniref:sulfhydryl oxidase 2 n=1 Tax=Brassica napus TaxID=3708 RepID=UPI00207A0B0C|nr:sulfhydryl oxidase 2 [Brassica napus]